MAGTIKGPEQLEDFLVSVGCDGYLVTSGDVLTSTFAATVYDVAPNVIVKAVRKRFKEVHALEMKFLSGEYTGDPPRFPEVPVSVTVCAQRVTSPTGVSPFAPRSSELGGAAS